MDGGGGRRWSPGALCGGEIERVRAQTGRGGKGEGVAAVNRREDHRRRRISTATGVGEGSSGGSNEGAGGTKETRAAFSLQKVGEKLP